MVDKESTHDILPSITATRLEQKEWDQKNRLTGARIFVYSPNRQVEVTIES